MREHLTCSNLPSCQCAICLYGFRDEDEFTKTPCFHHFHAHCLASYVRSCQETHRQEREKVPLWQKMQQKDSEECVVGFTLALLRQIFLLLNFCTGAVSSLSRVAQLSAGQTVVGGPSQGCARSAQLRSHRGVEETAKADGFPVFVPAE